VIVTSCGLGGTFFYFRLNSGNFRLNSGNFRLNSGEFRLNSGDSPEFRSKKKNQKNY